MQDRISKIVGRTGFEPVTSSVSREVCRSRLLSYFANDLRRVVRTRPLVSVAVSGDRSSVGYSVARVVLADR